MPQGGAAFMAMREYEKHEAANGQPPNHQFAKEVGSRLCADDNLLQYSRSI